MFIIGMLGASCWWLGYQVAIYGGLISAQAIFTGVCLSTFFLYQPRILELVTWPFIAFQLLMLSITAIAVSALVIFSYNSRAIYMCVFVVLSYITMHVFGVGVATALSSIITGSAVLILLRDEVCMQKMTCMVKTMMITAIIVIFHALLMVRTSVTPVRQTVSLYENLCRFAWVLMESTRAGLHSLWGPGAMQWPDMRVESIEMVYGWGVFFGISMFLFWVFYSYRATRNRILLATFALVAYPFIALVIYVLLIVFRLRFDSNNYLFLNYFIGSRYVIFPSFFLYLMGVGVFLPATVTLRRAIIPPSSIFAVTAIVGTAVFSMTLMKTVWPNTLIDTMSIWERSIYNTRASNDASASQQYFDATASGTGLDLRPYRYLLEHELNCVGCVKFEGD